MLGLRLNLPGIRKCLIKEGIVNLKHKMLYEELLFQINKPSLDPDPEIESILFEVSKTVHLQQQPHKGIGLSRGKFLNVLFQIYLKMTSLLIISEMCKLLFHHHRTLILPPPHHNPKSQTQKVQNFKSFKQS